MTSSLPLPILPARILVVDDHPVNRAVLAIQLEGLGLSCVTLASAAEALDTLKDGCFDLLMTDLHMPQMSGAELARRVREMSTIPIVLLTGREDMKYADAGPDSPFDAVVIKPASLDVLRSCLWRLLPGDVSPTFLSAPANVRSVQPDVFDLRELDALEAHGIDLRAFARDWCQSVEDDLAQLDFFRRKDDPKGIRDQLHRLGGAVGLVGAHGLMNGLEKANLTSQAIMTSTMDDLVEQVRVLMRQVSERGVAP
jgi:CheY-like chemotaxis protein